MADTGWKTPGTVEDIEKTGAAWNEVTLANAEALDSTYASVVIIKGGDSVCHWLRLTNYSADIPPDATIEGIVAENTRYAAAANVITDSSLRLWDGSQIQGEDKASAVYWPASPAAKTYGASDDKWGWSSVSPSDLNNSGFGIQIYMINNDVDNGHFAYLDCIRIKIYYSLAESFIPQVIMF